MESAWIGAAAACAGGVAVALINDRLSRAVLRRRPALLPSFFAVRQLINVLYLAALYFLSRVLPWGLLPLLIGGALGVTVPSMLLALRLARRNDAQRQEDAARSDTEGGNQNG